MKRYIDAELQIVRMSNHDVVTASYDNTLGFSNTSVGSADAADRFRDWEDF